MSLRKSFLGITGIILSFGMVALAQQTQPTTTTQDKTLKQDRLERRERLRERLALLRQRHGGPEGFRRRGAGPGSLMRGIQLSDEQRQQARAIMQRRLESTKSQREELFKLREKRIAGTFNADDEARAKALRQQITASMEGVRAEMQSILTAEQKARIEELQKERKARREQRMQEHQLRMKERMELRNKRQ
jgi:Spy/CpxP family protein refolding chaperone